MQPERYLMISTVACAPANLAEAKHRFEGVMGELRDQTPEVTAWFGMTPTGARAGSVLLFHGYRQLNDIEGAFAVYGTSPHFQAVAASRQISLTERNLIKLDQSLGPQDHPRPLACHALTQARPATATQDALTAGLPATLAAEAIDARLETFLTGTSAGGQMLLISYPSMAAIKAAPDPLAHGQAGAGAMAGMAEFTRDCCNPWDRTPVPDP